LCHMALLGSARKIPMLINRDNVLELGEVHTR
jgi:hypothetical protein